MVTFQVNDMTCGHCVSAITKALTLADRDAKVEINLNNHSVQVQDSDLDAQELGDAIREAGYTPLPIAGTVNADAPAKRGGCCGCS